MHIHKDVAADAGVRAKAGDIVVESYGDVEANIVRDGKEQAIASEASIGTKKDVTVCILVKV